MDGETALANTGQTIFRRPDRTSTATKLAPHKLWIFLNSRRQTNTPTEHLTFARKMATVRRVQCVSFIQIYDEHIADD